MWNASLSALLCFAAGNGRSEFAEFYRQPDLGLAQDV